MEKVLKVLNDIAGAACVLAIGLLGFTVCVLPTLMGGIAGDVMALIMLAMGVLLAGCALYDAIETRKYEVEGA